MPLSEVEVKTIEEIIEEVVGVLSKKHGIDEETLTVILAEYALMMARHLNQCTFIVGLN